MVASRQVEPRLTASSSKAHVSVANMTDFWYVACRANRLSSRKPLAVTILGTPLVLFRSLSGDVGALLDRCPHRNVPLSVGKVRGDCLQCPYHGWEFATDGACMKIPGLVVDAPERRRNDANDMRGRGAQAYPVREQQGFIWVFMNPGIEPTVEPYRLPHLDDDRYTHSWRQARANGTVHATIENALDVPHTSFLHKGLFRGTGDRNEITAIVRRWRDRCEAEYQGEPRPPGIVGRILSPGGGVVVHFDRFFLPSIAQVEYALSDTTHIVVTSMCTPVADFDTVLYAVVSFRLGPIPGWIAKPFLEPIGRAIFAQDRRILRLQTESIHRFGGEQFISTEIDLLGPHIWRLMKAAERGDAAPDGQPPFEKRVTMNV